jgi:multicomponent K+:H+ antiporter subunit E
MSLIKKLLPAPLTSAGLFGAWLVLARAPGAGHVLLGLALALGFPLMTMNLRPTAVSVRRPLVIVRFILTVGYDVLRSNIGVGLGVLAWRFRQPHAKFVIIPLELRDPLGLSALAMVTTVVPGTVWSELAIDRSALLLHVWDVPEEGAFVRSFKARYEAPLREIFE